MSKIILPGLIDPHVHLRDPGQTHKEDFYTGTAAALAGGYTTILDMPNNAAPITTLKRLEEKIKIAQEKIICDTGFYFGSIGDNLEEFEKVRHKVKGLKLYLNETTGNFSLPPGRWKRKLEEIFRTWPKGLPVLVHAEEKMVEEVISIVRKTKQRTHFCHISLQSELEMIVAAKEDGLPITCGVTPHHLFLTEDDEKYLGPYALMKPRLKKRRDVDYLWKHMGEIDGIESDHAPHTLLEKESNKPPFGVPGLETTLPLLLTAVSENKLTIDEVIRLCHDSPSEIFNIKRDDKTSVEIDLNSSFIIQNSSLFTKSKWSPFDGWKVKGKIQKVILRKKKVFENGQILAKPGFGKVV